ncbi:MAG: PfkB family carbohydrate kinase [Oscillospiraceae bacterium]|jgi:pseudouridine kinase|nr:PfkB family carbohydrate kinase [Oscillospiraceae bacterium]
MTQLERQLLQWIEAEPTISHKRLAQLAGISLEEIDDCISRFIARGDIAGTGYILRSETYAVVVGGVSIDIGGSALAPLVARDSNPGKVHMSIGGVGHNIAHNMRLLGVNTKLLTAFGDDMYAQRIAASCGEQGIDISHALAVPGAATSTYLYLNDPDGDMAIAMSDMAVCAEISPAYLADNLQLLNRAQLIVADTNLSEDSLQFLAENCTPPIFADPVSTAKAGKLRAVLPKIHTLKPNRIEAELLSGVKITDEESLRLAAKTLLDTGLRRVFISLGTQGVFAADHVKTLQQPCFAADMKNATGAGDAFMAALAWAYLEGTDLADSARSAAAAAAIAVEGVETINLAQSAAAVRARMNSKEK